MSRSETLFMSRSETQTTAFSNFLVVNGKAYVIIKWALLNQGMNLSLPTLPTLPTLIHPTYKQRH